MTRKSAVEEAFATQLRFAGISHWREHKFHPKRKWLFDFADIPQRVAVEIEGGTWSGGRHTRGKGFEADCEKYNEAALMGWCVLRVTSAMVTDGRALAFVERALGKESNEKS